MEDYKQKYEEALEKAKPLHKLAIETSYKNTRMAIEELFPELKESEDERIRKSLIKSYTNQHPANFPTVDGFTREQIIAWLEKQKEVVEEYEDKLDRCACESFDKGYKAALEKQGEQKPAWSEEDEQQMKSCLDFLDNISCGDDSELNDCRNWLKSLKERMKGECISVTDEELAQAKKDAYNDALDKIEYHSGEPTFDDGWSAAIWYLKKKNAQPQNTWKPSDKQINTLEQWLKNNRYNGDARYCYPIFDSLYQDLKKLRKE